MPARIERYAGDTFNSWTYVREVSPAANKHRRALWRCKCGREFVRPIAGIVAGSSKQCFHCGLPQGGKKNRRHGLYRSPEHQAWRHMKNRCSVPADKSWEDYGGRGITVCQEWVENFEAFYQHLGPRPGPGYSLDRINNDGNYEPGNVRWATKSEQNANQRTRRKKAA